MKISDTFYNLFMLPLEAIRLRGIRKRLIPYASGQVLELGAGTGANFRYYNSKVIDHLTVMDLSIRDSALAYKFKKDLKTELIEGDVVAMPFADETFDAVVFTLLFCSVGEPLQGLLEVYRVLKPGGKVLFMEHVLPHHEPLAKAFHRLNPAWMKMSKDCHIDRETIGTIKEAGFHIERMERHLKGAIVCGIGVK